MKLGKLAPKYDRRDLLLTRYLDDTKLPPIPESFGHEGVISDWRMLGNDRLGDCVLAGGGHETMLLSAIGGNGMVFDEAHTISDYSAITGYDPKDPSTDQGTLVRDAMKYRKDVGLADAFGNRHKIAAYVSIEPGNLEHVLTALYLFGAVGIGIQFPNSAMDQFNSGQDWSLVPGAVNDGGHYVPLVSFRNNLSCVTWGKLQEMTPTFFKAQCDECWAFITEEYLQNGKTPEGFAMDDLVSDLAKL